MLNKVFSSYSQQQGQPAKGRLVLETGNAHIACLVVSSDRNAVTDFELFQMTDPKQKFAETFTAVSSASALLNNAYGEVKVFIQNEESVIVPLEQYHKSIEDDYLDIVVGSGKGTVTITDKIPIATGYVNTYRVPTHTLEVLDKNFKNVSIDHTYSHIISNLFSLVENHPDQLIKVRFYQQHIIVAVLSGRKLQLVQTFHYQSPADVLYNLLSICQRLQISTASVVMQVSGMIYTDGELFASLQKYFKNIHTESTAQLTGGQGEFPLHYFTPFLNLAV